MDLTINQNGKLLTQSTNVSDDAASEIIQQYKTEKVHSITIFPKPGSTIADLDNEESSAEDVMVIELL